MSECVVEKDICVIAYKRRSKPRLYYQGEILRYYVPYVVYFRGVPSEENIKRLVEFAFGKVNGKEKAQLETIMFRGLYVDKIVNFAKVLGAEIVYVKRYLDKLGRVVDVPVMIFDSRYSAMRHTLFALSISTLKSISKVDAVWDVVMDISIAMIEVLYNSAVFRYWSGNEKLMYAIGEGFRTMYLIK